MTPDDSTMTRTERWRAEWRKPGSFVRGLVVWTPIAAATFTLIFNGTDRFLARFAISASISASGALLCYLSMRALFAGAAWVWQGRGRTWQPPSVGRSYLLAGLLLPAALPLAFGVGMQVSRLVGIEWSGPSAQSYRIGFGFGIVVLLLFFLQQVREESRTRLAENEARRRELETRRLEAELSALRAEMNPHLLFNALNTIASLIHDDRDRAEAMVLELSDLYRGVLRASNGAMQSLEDELRLVEAYLHVERARLGDALEASIAVEDGIDASEVRVPTLLLQPLVENAIVHGLSQKAGGGTVRVQVVARDAQIVISVRDDGAGLGGSRRKGSGRSLENGRRRLELAYGGEAELSIAALEPHGTVSTVRIPTKPRAEAREASR